MLLRFSKVHCLGDDVMLVDGVTQQAYVQPGQVQRWASRVFGIGFKRLLLIDVPLNPEVDFNCRVFNPEGVELDCTFIDLCCALRLVHDRRLTQQATVSFACRNGTQTVRMNADGWMVVEYSAPQQSSQRAHSVSPALQQHLQAIAQRHALDIEYVTGETWILVSGQQPAPQRLARLLQPMARQLRGLHVIWLHAHEQGLAAQRWPLNNDGLGFDPMLAVAQALQHSQAASSVRVDWQHGTLEINYPPNAQVISLRAVATRVYEGQLRL